MRVLLNPAQSPMRRQNAAPAEQAPDMFAR
jgi:hypothetical protein